MNYTFTAEERREIIALMNREIVPAIGCTEPIAVALCVAKATETLGCRPERIEARLMAQQSRIREAEQALPAQQTRAAQALTELLALTDKITAQLPVE